jgi:transcriptional regulator with XRE-family HTH domain
MTQANERTATLSALVAEEIRALMARRRMSGRQLAGQLGVSPSWVSYRLTGTQPIDVNDLALIAKALEVGVHELLPPPDVAARAVDEVMRRYRSIAEQLPTAPARPRDTRPPGHPVGAGIRRSSLLPRPHRRPGA